MCNIQQLYQELLMNRRSVYIFLSIGGLLISFGGSLELENTNGITIFFPFVILLGILANFQFMIIFPGIWNWHPPYAGYVKDIATGVMWFLVVALCKWAEKSFGSILLFIGLIIWFKFLLLAFVPPTDLGVYSFLVGCLLNQFVNYFQVENTSPYWFSVLFAVLSLVERIVRDIMQS